MASFKEFIESITQKPIEWTDEQIAEALAGDYVLDDTEEEDLPQLMQDRHGIPIERAKEYLKAYPPEKEEEEGEEEQATGDFDKFIKGFEKKGDKYGKI